MMNIKRKFPKVFSILGKDVSFLNLTPEEKETFNKKISENRAKNIEILKSENKEEFGRKIKDFSKANIVDIKNNENGEEIITIAMNNYSIIAYYNKTLDKLSIINKNGGIFDNNETCSPGEKKAILKTLKGYLNSKKY